MASRLKFEISADEYARHATAEADALRQAADAIAAGTLDGIPRESLAFAAAVVRAFADQIPTVPPAGRGGVRRFDHGVAAVLFLVLRRQGLSANKAHEQLAEEFGVVVTTMKNALKQQNVDALVRLLANT